METRRYINKIQRLRELQADRCILCWGEFDGRGYSEPTGNTLHHVVEKKDGGKDSDDNLIVVHRSCHDNIHAMGSWYRRL